MKAITIVGVAALTLSTLAWAGMEEDVAQVRHEWERVKYTVAPKQQEAEFEKLSGLAASVMEKYPNLARHRRGKSRGRQGRTRSADTGQKRTQVARTGAHDRPARPRRRRLYEPRIAVLSGAGLAHRLR